MASGKDIVKYMKRIRDTPRKSYAERQVLYDTNKEAHAAAFEKGYITKLDIHIYANGRREKDVWLLTTAGADFLRQLKGDFSPRTGRNSPWEYKDIEFHNKSKLRVPASPTAPNSGPIRGISK